MRAPLTPEPVGLYAVVRVWSPSGSTVYVSGPLVDWDDGTYWFVLGSEDGWSWDQVMRYAVRVEVVREGIAAGVAS